MAADALPISPPPMLPPPALKARIMAEVEREAALLASASEPPRASRSASAAGVRLVADRRRAALACAALLPGSASARLLFGGRRAARSTFEADPSLQQASAELEIDGDKAILVADGLPAPPEGQVYMVWVRADGTPEPTSALFTPRSDGSATASVTGDLDDVETVLVNTEPVGG